MPYMKNKRTGEIVEVGADGRPVGGRPPMNPEFPYKGPQAAADLAGKRVSTAKTVQDMQLAPREIALRERQAAVADRNLSIEEQKQRQAQIQAERERALARAPMDSLNNQLRRVWDLYADGPGSTPAWSPASLADFNPYSDKNSKFNAAAAGIGEIGRNAFRTPGQGAQSDKELQAFIDANQPKASDTDAAIREKLGNLERRLGSQYKALGVPYQPYQPRSLKPPPRKQTKQNRVIDFGSM